MSLSGAPLTFRSAFSASIVGPAFFGFFAFFCEWRTGPASADDGIAMQQQEPMRVGGRSSSRGEFTVVPPGVDAPSSGRREAAHRRTDRQTGSLVVVWTCVLHLCLGPRCSRTKRTRKKEHSVRPTKECTWERRGRRPDGFNQCLS